MVSLYKAELVAFEALCAMEITGVAAVNKQSKATVQKFISNSSFLNNNLIIL